MIPNIFHFIYYYKPDIKFPLAHFININSAIELNKPEKVYFYSDRTPKGYYWDKISDKIDLIHINPPEKIFGNKIYHVAHKSDVLRLEILKEKGGIYLDLDVICKKPFADLFHHSFVMGKQGKYRVSGLCNGVIMSQNDNDFLQIWYNEFKNFRSKGKDKYWDEMSVKMPYKLSKRHKELIHVEPYSSFHYPLFYKNDIKKIFEKCYDYKKAYCHHYWDGISFNKYLKNITEEEIKNIDTTYNVIARKYI